MLTDNKILIQAAQKHYKEFLVPFNNVESIKKKRKFNSEEKADLDIKISCNKIGEIINLSQELNTIFWNNINHGRSIKDMQELYCDICTLDIASNIEIDKSKREFVVDITQEMQKIKEKWIITNQDGRIIKPNFFGHIARQKGFYNSKSKYYKKHMTAMDYLQQCVNEFQYTTRQKKDIILPFSAIFNLEEYDYDCIDYRQVGRIIGLVKDCKNKINYLYTNSALENIKRYELVSEIRQECIEYVGNIKMNFSTMFHLIKTIESLEYKQLYKTIINILFGYPNTDFFKLIQKSVNPIPILTLDDEGEIIIFNQKYTKMT